MFNKIYLNYTTHYPDCQPEMKIKKRASHRANYTDKLPASYWSVRLLCFLRLILRVLIVPL